MNFTKTLTKTGPLKQHWCIFGRRPCLSRSWCYITFNQPNSGSGFRTKHHRSLAVISSKSAKDLSSKWPCWKKQQTLRWRRNNSAHTYGAKVTECLEFKDETSRSLPGLPGRRWQKEWKSLFAIKTTDWTLDHVLTIWTSENRRPLSFECRCKAGHIVAQGQRHKCLCPCDTSWLIFKNRYGRDKFLNGYWSEPWYHLSESKTDWSHNKNHSVWVSTVLNWARCLNWEVLERSRWTH